MMNSTKRIMQVMIMVSTILLTALLTEATISREENFEFAQQPQVSKSGDNYIITFAAAAKCDATVAIMKDGIIVRHLASGVLGANAPWPFAKDVLAQSLEWDGKDDAGNPAPDSCIVRVSLGLKASYAGEISAQGSLGFFPVCNMICDKQGLLHVFTKGNIRSFDKEGKYVRTLLPTRSDVARDKVPFYDYNATTDGDKVIAQNHCFQAGTGTFSGTIYGGISGLMTNHGNIAYLPSSNRMLMISSNAPGYYMGNSYFLYMDCIDGAMNRIENTNYKYNNGEAETSYLMSMAATPDEQSVYLDICHAVYKVPAASPNTMTTPFLGEAGVAGSDAQHFNNTNGLAVDASGNIYVSDNANNRIQVFKPDGSLLRSIALTGPGKIFVHPVTGNIYCCSGRIKIVKFSPEGTELAKWINNNDDGEHPDLEGFCLDAASEPPAIWVCLQSSLDNMAAKQPIIKRLEDRDGAFVDVLTIPICGSNLPFLGGHAPVSVDPVTDDVYANNAEIYLGGLRYNGNTLTLDTAWTKSIGISCNNIGFGRDGLVYFRTGTIPKEDFIYRLDRSGKPVDFPNGVSIDYLMPDWGVDFLKGINYKGLPTDDHQNGDDNAWKKGLDVAPNGDIYLITGSLDVPDTLRVFDNLGNLKCPYAAVHLGYARASTVKAGREGAFYLGTQYGKAGAALPEGLAENENAGATWAGSVIKVGNKEWPAVRFYGSEEIGKPAGISPQLYLFGQGWSGGGDYIVVDSLHWAYYGLTGMGMASGGCICHHQKFDMDRFERCFLPCNYLYSVIVLDANGNRVLRIGRYGNPDSRGPGSPVPNPDIAFCFVKAVTVSDKALYVCDIDNNRLLKAGLSYENEVFKALDNTTISSAEGRVLSAQAVLYQSVPNPFNVGGGVIPYFLPRQSRVSLTIYDLRGRVMHRLVNMETQPAGRHQAQVRSGLLKSSGVYIYELKAGSFKSRKRMAVLQ